MLHAVDDLIFATPHGFVSESSTVCLRAPAGAPGSLRPNIVVHRRRAARGATLAVCAAAAGAEIAAQVPGVGRIESAEIAFDDGASGVLLSYAFPSASAPGVEVAQLQALRLDQGTLSSITITTAAKLLTEALRGEYRKALASAHPEARPPS